MNRTLDNVKRLRQQGSAEKFYFVSRPTGLYAIAFPSFEGVQAWTADYSKATVMTFKEADRLARIYCKYHGIECAAHLIMELSS